MPLNLFAKKQNSPPIPNTVREMLPIKQLDQDGIFLGTDDSYSRVYSLTDINLEPLDAKEHELILLGWSAFINSIDDDATAKVTLVSRRRHRTDVASGLLAKDAGDKNDKYRHEINELIIASSTGDNCMLRNIYVTISKKCESMDAAKTYFSRVDGDASALLATIACRVKPLRGKERLALLYELMRLGTAESTDFGNFEWRKEMGRGTDLRDRICPNGIAVKPTYLTLEESLYARSMYIERYPSTLHDDLLAKLCDTGCDMIISLDLLPTDSATAQKMVAKKLDGVNANATRFRQRQSRNNNWTTEIPYQVQEQIDQLTEMLTDLRQRDQRLILTNFTLTLFADSLDKLETATDRVKTPFKTEGAKLSTLVFQQMQGLVTSLPFGAKQVEILRTLTTESVCAFVPFRALEVQDEGGIYCGRNALSRSPIVVDRFRLLNYNGFRLGVPGSGKSLGAKFEIFEALLFTDAKILICDPEREYTDLVQALGGTVVRIAPGSGDHINAMELDEGYGDTDPIAEKSVFIQTLVEQIKQQPVSAYERSIIDRCVATVYEQYRRGGAKPRLPILVDTLNAQREPEAANLALALEMFTSGTLNIFAHETNVDLSARLISFDIRDVGPVLKPVAMAVIIDAFRNHVARNSLEGKRTYIYLDEFHVALETPYMERYLESSYRQFRKRGAAPTGITQNVQTLLTSPAAAAMLQNSEYIVMHAQGHEDAQALAEMLDIPSALVSRLRGGVKGAGLIRVGETIVPFDNRIPDDLEIYKLMTTNFTEWSGGGGGESE